MIKALTSAGVSVLSITGDMTAKKRREVIHEKVGLAKVTILTTPPSMERNKITRYFVIGLGEAVLDANIFKDIRIKIF